MEGTPCVQIPAEYQIEPCYLTRRWYGKSYRNINYCVEGIVEFICMLNHNGNMFQTISTAGSVV